MITIDIPSSYEIERCYIIGVIFGDFLGLEFQIQVSERNDVCIRLGESNKILIFDGLFSIPPHQWLQPASLPKQPLKVWEIAKAEIELKTVNSRLPIIYGEDPDNPEFFYRSETEIYLGIDIFGSAFFMMSRYEEIVKPERDRHDRFPVAISLAYQENFLDRPIINEYIEILWVCLKKLCPTLERSNRQFQIHLSHDVDVPFRYALSGSSRLLKRLGGDIIKRHSFRHFSQSISDWFQVKVGNPYADPCNTFDAIMNISEAHNIKSAFYFITDNSGGDRKEYTISHPLVRQLMRNIHDRGHEIGIHPSYNTYKDAKQTLREFKLLQQLCEEEKIHQDYWGGRQHYLRWENPITFQNWEDAEINYDSSLCFAEMPGFRCGVCYEFPVFNILTRKALKLRERPLVVMEQSVFSNVYMGLDFRDTIAYSTILSYKHSCELFSGQFTLLWHNDHLVEQDEFELYKRIIESTV